MWDLDPDKQAFVDAVLAPLPPDDKARDMLEESVQIASQVMRDGGTAEAREAAARMQASAPAYRKRRLLLRVLGIATMLAIAWFTWISPAVLQPLRETVDVSNLASDAMPRFMRKALAFEPESRLERFEQSVSERLAPEHRFTAQGDLSQGVPRFRWKAVWDRYPDSAAHYAVYAEAYRQTQNKWPEDFVATGERLDPGNGWFRWFTVMTRAQAVIEPAKSAPWVPRGTPRPPGTPASIKSETELQEILADWDRALEMPRWHSYSGELDALRLQGLLPPEDVTDHLLSFYFTVSALDADRAFWVGFLPLNQSVIPVLAEHYASKGNRASLEALAARYVKTLERLADAPADIHQLMVRSLTSKTSKSLGDAFGKLGDTARESQFLTFSRQMDHRIMRPPVLSTPDALEEDRGSSLVSNHLGGSARFTPVEEKDLRGGRLAEYALVERILMHEFVLLMSLVILILWLAGLRERRGPREMCSRLCGLLRPVDRAWIIGLGILLPVSVYVLCMRLPALETRGFGLDEARFLPVLALSCGLLLSIILGIAETVHWRLSRRAMIAGFGWHGLKPGRWIAMLVLMSMPASIMGYKAYVKWSLDWDWVEISYLSLLALPLLWILWMCVAFFTGAVHRRLQRMVMLRAMVPYLILGVLLAALAIPALYQEEKYWTRRIVYEAVNSSNPRFNGRTSEYAAWARDQLRTALNDLKKAGP